MLAIILALFMRQVLLRSNRMMDAIDVGTDETVDEETRLARGKKFRYVT